MALKLLGRTGAVTGKDVSVSDLLRIGASADNEFRIVVSGVSRSHARVVKKDDAYWIEDAGSTNGTFVNGQRVVKERLRHLDVVTLGKSVDLIIVSNDRVEPALPAAITDAWLAPADAAGGARVDLPPGEITLGRLAPSNVILDSQVVSKLHVRIERTAEQVIAQDLGSANGTFVNGQKISAVTLLKDGDSLSIAGVRSFRVHVTGDARGKQQVAASSSGVFDQEWKTKLVWSADELATLEAERQKIVAAAGRAQAAGGKAAAGKPAPVAAKPAAPPAVAKPAAPPVPAAKPDAPAPVAVRPPVVPAPPAPKPDPPAPVAARPPVAPAAIAGIKLTGPAGTFTLGKGRHAVGRIETAQVPVADALVSRNHAAFIVGDTGASIEDTKSVNGTFVNGVRLKDQSVPLKTGDRVKFGDAEFTVELMV